MRSAHIRVLVYVACAMPTTLAATTFTVAPNGPDTDADGRTRPWRTLRKAADEAQAGGLVLVEPGVYPEAVILKHSGVKFRSRVPHAAALDGGRQGPT